MAENIRWAEVRRRVPSRFSLPGDGKKKMVELAYSSSELKKKNKFPFFLCCKLLLAGTWKKKSVDDDTKCNAIIQHSLSWKPVRHE